MNTAWTSCAHATIAALAMICCGCAHVSGVLPPPMPGTGTNEFRAGAAKVDITPPPGYPMGGHAIAAHTSRGHWLRLHARSLYLESGAGDRLVMVITDLWSMPGGLGDRVVELVGANAPARCRIDRSQLLLSATHTHQSPGNFSTSRAYNALGSNQPGFDPDLFDFLATRIAGAVAAACERSVPARLSFKSARVGAIARNRSMEAFLANDEALGIIEANADLPVGETRVLYPDPRAYRAVLPILDTLWIHEARKPGQLIGVAAVFPMHPTALSHHAIFYSSDATGWAATTAEQRLGRTQGESQPVVAVFNGAEGDVSPVWDEQNREDVERVGDVLAEAIVAQASAASDVASTISTSYRVYPIAGACLPSDPAQHECVFTAPMPGPAMLGGAEDGLTVFYQLGCREGTSFDDSPNAATPGAICGLVHILQPLVLALLPTPRVVPLGIYRVGPIVFVSLPGEFTTTLGLRIRNRLRQALQGPGQPEHIVVIGLANEYLSYFTTQGEYGRYSYESGSTMYGPLSGRLVEELVVDLATTPSTPTTASQPFDYDAGFVRLFVPSSLTVIEPGRADAQLRAILLGDNHAPTVWRQHCFNAPAPSLHDAGAHIFAPDARVEMLVGGVWQPAMVDGQAEDDRGLHFVTVLTDGYGMSSTWCATWVARRDRLQAFRDEDTFRVCAGMMERSSCSAPFTLVSAVVVAKR